MEGGGGVRGAWEGGRTTHPVPVGVATVRGSVIRPRHASRTTVE